MTAGTTPVGSVIVPAWNESAVIGRTLDALFRGIDPAAIDVVVACNGCTDDTADVARRSGHPVRVLDLPAPGKVGAIRAAEAATDVLPRLYLDADTELPGRSALAVLDVLAAGAVAARPPAEHDTAGASWPVRAFYSVRESLPEVTGHLYGAGVYGLSAEGRARFGEFPDVTADDLFAARLVADGELVIPDVPPVTVRVPRDVRSLVTTLARVYRGNRELARARPDLAPTSTAQTTSGLRRLARDPRRWPQLTAYVALVIAGRWRSRRGAGGWDRDDSARAAEVAAS